MWRRIVPANCASSKGGAAEGSRPEAADNGTHSRRPAPAADRAGEFIGPGARVFGALQRRRRLPPYPEIRMPATFEIALVRPGRRAIPDLRSPNLQLRSAAERMAINFPMQSLAADIIKIAMVRLHREIEADHIEGRMLLQVHDELLFEVPEGEVDRFAETVPRIMTGAYELETGIEVEAKAGPNWADMQKLAVVRA